MSSNAKSPCQLVNTVTPDIRNLVFIKPEKILKSISANKNGSFEPC